MDTKTKDLAIFCKPCPISIWIILVWKRFFCSFTPKETLQANKEQNEKHVEELKNQHEQELVKMQEERSMEVEVCHFDTFE